jgi:hypothetical protein
MSNDKKPEAPAPKDDMVTMSKADIQAMIMASTAQAMAAAGMMAPAPITQEEAAARKYAEEHPVGRPVAYVPFCSREPFGTGAVMLLVISHRGVVVGIHNYTPPVGFDKPREHADAEPGPLGRLPPGKKTSKADGSPDTRQLMMIYHQYYAKDNHTLLRRPLLESGRMTEAEVAEQLKLTPKFLMPESGDAVGAVA